MSWSCECGATCQDLGAQGGCRYVSTGDTLRTDRSGTRAAYQTWRARPHPPRQRGPVVVSHPRMDESLTATERAELERLRQREEARRKAHAEYMRAYRALKKEPRDGT